MSARDTRRMSASPHDDRAPLLGRTVDAPRERGDLPLWRHVLENKMTWALYNIVISSGSVSLLLYTLPYRVHRLWVFGAAIYVFALILFLVTLLTHVVRFLVRPSMLRDSIVHPTEGQHVSTLPLALGVLLLNGATYGEKMGGHNVHAMKTFYWIFVWLAIIFSVASPLTLFSHMSTSMRHNGRGRGMASTNNHNSSGAHNPDTPSSTGLSFLPILPLSLAGPAAAVVLAHMKTTGQHNAALSIMAFGVALQGAGIILSIGHQTHLLGQLHKYGFGPANSRLSLFLASVPSALTSLAATSLAEQALRHFPTQPDHDGAATDIVGGLALYYFGITMGLVFWGVSTWWFVIAAAGLLGEVKEAVGGRTGDGSGWHQVIFAHAALFVASNELLRVFAWPKGLTIVNELLGVATVLVWAIVILVGATRIGSGGYRD
ncbi:voltage-dependent anion channel [Geopyxis carbonaria]|nr:voltage-dependent anion channel [Geopyxis carbonaria]